MLRPIIDEYVLAKIMNKICPAKFTDEWVHEVKKNYQKSFLTPEIVNHWDSCSNASSNENLLVQMRLSDDGFGLNNNSFNPERTDLITNMNGKNNNNVHTRDRGMYLKSLEDTVAFIARNSEQVSQLPQQHHQLNNPSQSQQPISADVNELLQDIRNYFLANDAIEERRRHFSSISDGSSSSESSNNNSNRQFENILQKIFDFSQICDDQKISNGFDGLGNLNFDQAFNDAFQAARQIESREELSSGYGRSSSASSSNDSANPLSIGNAPTHGSLTVNIGSVLSDSGNGSPTTGLFCVKNSSSSASSFTQETNGLNMKEYLDDTIPDLKRNRVNTNPADEMFRLNDRISPGASLSSHDSEVQINNPGLYFDTSSPCFYDEEKRMFANNIPSEPVSVSTWDTPVTICQETSLTPTNSCFILSTGSRSVNRSFSVGASQKVEKVAPQLMNSNIRQDYDSFSPNLMNSNDFKRKKVYEFIVGQLYADGYQNIANQILQAEGLSGLNFSNNTKLQNLTSSKMRISNESFPSESELFIPQQTSSNVDSFFNTTNSFGQRLNNAVYDSSFGSFNRSNSVSVTIANNVMPNKMFISNRSQSQVAVTNSLNMTPQPIPMTAPALLDSSNFMLNENAMKNINQLAIKLNMEQHLNGSHNDVSNLMMAGSRLNSLAKTPCHTTGNGKTCKEMSIKAKFGNLGAGINQFSSPHGFCLGFNEELVIADTTNHRICVYDKNGKFKSSFGTPGREEGQLYNPRKIATIVLNRGGTESQCYVICDRGSERSRMQIFTRSGTFVRKILITFMEIVAGIAVNSRGQIVAVDSVYSTIFTLDDQGSLKKFVECSDYMREPSDIAIYKDQYYICDFKGHYVAVFDMEGKFIRKIGGEGLTSFPNGIDIYPNGRVLVGDSHGNRFHIAAFTNDGNLIAEYECPHVKVSRCCGLKITREGLIVTLAKNNHHVLVLNPLA